jgi:hypothetical protein
LAALAVSSLILGQLAVVGHYALVAHYVCAEHGTLHHGRAPALTHARPTPATRSVQAFSREDHGSHDECAFPARQGKQVAAPAASELALGAPSSTARSSATTSGEPDSSIPLLALAPKQSPPRG